MIPISFENNKTWGRGLYGWLGTMNENGKMFAELKITFCVSLV